MVREDIERLVVEARTIANVDERGARLFVIATTLLGSDDAAEQARARELLAEAAQAGSSHAALELGLMLTSGRGGPVDGEGGVASIVRAAEAGLAAAQLFLGGALLGAGARAAQGVAWLRKAAAAQEWSAFWLLGVAYLRGLGVARDAAQARVMLQAAAQHDIAEAQLELAVMYAGGVGGARDEAAAAAWEKRAAEAGDAVACLRVADRALAQAGGVARALPWLERAAAGGSAEAAERLALLHSDGRELTRDDAAAARWRARADEIRGSADSMEKCATCGGSGKVDCPACAGTGSDGRELCTSCDPITNDAGEPVAPSGKVGCGECGGSGKR